MLDQLDQSIRRVLLAQVILAVFLIVVLLAAAGWSGAVAIETLEPTRVKAVAFGAFLGILATLVTVRSVIKSSRAVTENPSLVMLPIYSGLLLKFLLVAGGFFMGMVYLQLGPLYIALGYISMQVGYVWVGKPAA